MRATDSPNTFFGIHRHGGYLENPGNIGEGCRPGGSHQLTNEEVTCDAWRTAEESTLESQEGPLSPGDFPPTAIHPPDKWGWGGKGIGTTNQEGKARQRPRSGVPLRVLDHSLPCFDAGNSITCVKGGLGEKVFGGHMLYQ